MRGALPRTLALILIVPVLAGCLGGDAPANDAEAAEPMVPAVPAVDGKTVVDHIETFSKTYPKRNANGPDHNAARDHLANELEAAGLEVLRQTFTAEVQPTSTPTNVVANDGTLQNIIGIKWGVERDSWVVIGGHYDTTDAAIQGAYDDGSGTILTLELAKAFAALETEKTIAFFLFDGEEQGLRGSAHFVASLSDGSFAEEFSLDPEIFAMIDLDMFGINWPIQQSIYFDDNSELIRTFVDASRTEIGIPDELFQFRGITAGRSDYAPFEDAGIPVAFFISAFEQFYVGSVETPECQRVAVDALDVSRTQCFTYPFWHRADTIETMELIAGDRAILNDGFAVAARLASELLHFVGTTPGLELDVREPEA